MTLAQRFDGQTSLRVWIPFPPFNLWRRMNWTVRILILIFSSTFLGSGYAQATGEVEALFEEAQRFHLGLDQSVDYSRALSLYKQVIQAEPNHKDALYNMAHIFIAQKRYDLAISHYKRVISINPQDSDAYNNLGSIYLLQGEAKSAKRAYAKAIQLNPDLAVAYYNLTFVFFKEGDKVRAEKAISEAIRLEPDNADFVKLQSQILGERGKISDWWAVAAFGGFGGFIAGYYWLFGRKGV
jgi:tetratricopeptide (TPR) repeat protein